MNPPIQADVTSAAWPFNRPTLASLRASRKKVFAHYVPSFPISLDNQAMASDYYQTKYLQPGGENGKFAYCGGFIRERPRGRAPINAGNWQYIDLRQEVYTAAIIGIDGFAFSITATSGSNWTALLNLLDAARDEDPGFKIVLMPDMDAEFKTNPGTMVDAIAAVAAHPSIYRLADGRVVLAPFNAMNQSAAWWQAQIAALAQKGVPIAFVPVFQGWKNYAAAYAPISYGLSDWGSRNPFGAAGMQPYAALAHGYVQVWMSPVGFNDVRPKNLIYVETEGSLGNRNAWMSAINGGADWVQLATWNDYSECSEFQPSSGIQGNFYNLTAYYTTWFKTGAQPPITKDALYYFHRTHSITAQPDLGKQLQPYTCVVGTPIDRVELLAFLTAPGTISIQIGNSVITKDVPAGISSMTAAVREGTPMFRLTRGGQTIIDVTSLWTISNKIIYQDVIYRGSDSLIPTGVSRVPAPSATPSTGAALISVDDHP